MLSSNWKGLLTPLLFSSQVIFSQALSLSYLKLDHEAWLYIFYNKIKARGEKLASKKSQAISWFKGQFVFNFPYSTFWFDQNPTTIWIGKCKIFSGISDTFVQIVLRNLCLTLLMSLTLIGINYKSKKMLIFSATSGFYP